MTKENWSSARDDDILEKARGSKMINCLLDNIVLFVFGRIALLDFRYASNTERRTGPIVPTERATAWGLPARPR